MSSSPAAAVRSHGIVMQISFLLKMTTLAIAFVGLAASFSSKLHNWLYRQLSLRQGESCNVVSG